MSHLLEVTRLNSPVLKKQSVVPLCLEFSVSRETAPYLVTSSSSLMWVADVVPGPTSMVRAAVREVPLDDLFQEILDSVVAMGTLQDWGNVHPLTKEGLQGAIDHVASYDLEPLEILVPRSSETEDSSRPLLESAKLPFRPSTWVPVGTIVVVPKDRGFVGVVSRLTQTKLAGIVHNAARGIGICRGVTTNELAVEPLPSSEPG